MFSRNEIAGRKRNLVHEIMERLEKTHRPESEVHKRVRKALLKKLSFIELDSLWIMTLTACETPDIKE